jgi:CBS domain containing-hemolysin-like protein
MAKGVESKADAHIRLHAFSEVIFASEAKELGVPTSTHISNVLEEIAKKRAHVITVTNAKLVVAGLAGI